MEREIATLPPRRGEEEFIPEEKQVDIVIPWWNNNDLTLKCLESIAENTTIPYRVILINNGSEDSVSVLEKIQREIIWPKNLVVKQNIENVGWVKAVNQGLKEFLKGDGDYVVIMNNDTEVVKGWLKALKTKMEKDKELGLVSPLVDTKDQDIYWEHYQKEKDNKYVSFIPFVCTMASKYVIQEVGLLDEKIDNGMGDDMDYCIRVKKMGLHIGVVKDIVIHHKHGASFSKLPNLEELKHKNRTYVNEKHEIKSGMENDPRYLV